MGRAFKESKTLGVFHPPASRVRGRDFLSGVIVPRPFPPNRKPTGRVIDNRVSPVTQIHLSLNCLRMRKFSVAQIPVYGVGVDYNALEFPPRSPQMRSSKKINLMRCVYATRSTVGKMVSGEWSSRQEEGVASGGRRFEPLSPRGPGERVAVVDVGHRRLDEAVQLAQLSREHLRPRAGSSWAREVQGFVGRAY